MRRITVRDLQVNPTKEFEELPAEVTRYGRTLGYLVADTGKPIPAEKKSKELETEEEVKEAFQKAPIIGRCIACGVKEEVVEIVYDDVDGNRMVTQACEAKGIKWMKNQVDKMGGKILKIGGEKI